MGIETKGYIFEKMKNIDFFNKLNKIKDLEIEYHNISKFKENIKCRNGYLLVRYKGYFKKLFVTFYNDTKDYNNLNVYTKGINKVLSQIPNFGEDKSYIVISLEAEATAVHLMKRILKEFGGVLVPNDCSNLCAYVTNLN